jgi:uncharacterized protein YjdB
MKKLSFLLSVFILSAVSSLISCDKDDDKSLSFNPVTVEVETGKTADVTVSKGVTPYTATSGDSKIATVEIDKTNKSLIKITGVKEGSTTITVQDKDKTSGKILVKVVKGLALDKAAVEVETGKTAEVKVSGGKAPYTVAPKDKAIADAEVKDDKITVKGMKAGKTEITVTDADKKAATISVTVK